MTKIITDKGNEIILNYDEIEKFCINEIMTNKEYLIEFKEFKKKYNYFNACFDFIFHKKKYKLIEPLLFPNTYLYNLNNNYYILENKEELQNKEYYDFSLMNEICSYIAKNPFEIYEGFFILNDGTILTNNYVERHLKCAKMILNNYLIKSSYIYKKYLKFIESNDKNFQYYINDFIIEELGIIYGKKIGRNIDLIMNTTSVTKPQINTLKKLKKYYNVKNEDYNNYNNKMTYFNR